jgi:Legume-like lectin family.
MKNHHTNILLRNTLFTCISALTIGSSFILSEQTAHAEDSVQQTTKVDVEKSDESISSPEISQDKSAKDKSNDYGNIDKEQEIANNQSNLQNSSTHPLDPAQILDSAIEDQGSTEVSGSDNANDQPSVTVDKDNFEEFFTTHGDATYDQETGTVTLTPDKQNQVGNFTMNQKIDLNQSFNLKGKVNLGSKTQNKGGADGIGFAFHTGNTDSVVTLGEIWASVVYKTP